MQNEEAMPPKLNGRLIMNAIRRLNVSSGLTIPEIKKHLKTKKGLEYETRSIKLYLKTAVERGSLDTINGKYKVKTTANLKSKYGGLKRPRRRSSNSKTKSLGTLKVSKRRSDSRSGKRSKKTVAKAEEAVVPINNQEEVIAVVNQEVREAGTVPTDNQVHEEVRAVVDQEVIKGAGMVPTDNQVQEEVITVVEQEVVKGARMIPTDNQVQEELRAVVDQEIVKGAGMVPSDNQVQEEVRNRRRKKARIQKKNVQSIKNKLGEKSDDYHSNH